MDSVDLGDLGKEESQLKTQINAGKIGHLVIKTFTENFYKSFIIPIVINICAQHILLDKRI